MFRNSAWHVAAWDHEITRNLQQSAVLRENPCDIRVEAGARVRLEDAAPHRLTAQFSQASGKASPGIDPPIDSGQFRFRHQVHTMNNDAHPGLIGKWQITETQNSTLQ